MAEVEETVQQEEEAPAVAAASGGRGRGRGAGAGRGKAKGKGKKKAKAKAKKAKAAAAPVAEEGAEGVEKPKAEKKLSLKQQIEAEINSRPIDDVIKETREKVATLQAAVGSVQKEEVEFETTILEGKKKMEACTAAVDACVAKESLAFEKFKAARAAVIDSQKKVLEKKVELAAEEKALAVLASEGDMRTKEADLRKAKAEAAEAAAAAKKALEEAKQKEKEAMESLKSRRKQAEGEGAEERMKEALAKDAEEKAAKEEAKKAAQGAGKSLKDDLKKFDIARVERDKARIAAFKEAAGLGKAKKRLALADGSAASPAKVAKTGGIQDVD